MKTKKKAHTFSKPVFWNRVVGEPYIITSKDPIAKVDEFLSLGSCNFYYATDESVALFFGVSVDDIHETFEKDGFNFLNDGWSEFPRVWKIGAMVDRSNNLTILTEDCVIRLAPYLAEKSEVAKELYSRKKDEFVYVQEFGNGVFLKKDEAYFNTKEIGGM